MAPVPGRYPMGTRPGRCISAPYPGQQEEEGGLTRSVHPTNGRGEHISRRDIPEDCRCSRLASSQADSESNRVVDELHMALCAGTFRALAPEKSAPAGVGSHPCSGGSCKRLSCFCRFQLDMLPLRS